MQVIGLVKAVLRPIPGVGHMAKAVLDYGIYPAIVLKWCRDKRHLPLQKAHYRLYVIIHLKYWICFRDFPRLVRCRGFNDRVQWLKLFDQDTAIVDCSDKLAVRDYVRERIGEEHLTRVYQAAERFADLDLENLPDQFVLKTNNESGNVVLVPDKAQLNVPEARQRLESGLERMYGWQNGEWPYRFIPPRIFAEEYLEPENKLRPPDYKFHCVKGQVRCLHFIYDRGQVAKEVFATPEGEIIPIHACARMEPGYEFEKPREWEQLKRVAERLAAGWRYVRVDLYLVRGKVVFGELTFYPGYGGYTRPGERHLGELIDFDRGTFKPPVLHGANLQGAARPTAGA